MKTLKYIALIITIAFITACDVVHKKPFESFEPDYEYVVSDTEVYEFTPKSNPNYVCIIFDRYDQGFFAYLKRVNDMDILKVKRIRRVQKPISTIDSKMIGKKLTEKLEAVNLNHDAHTRHRVNQLFRRKMKLGPRT